MPVFKAFTPYYGDDRCCYCGSDRCVAFLYGESVCGYDYSSQDDE